MLYCSPSSCYCEILGHNQVGSVFFIFVKASKCVSEVTVSHLSEADRSVEQQAGRGVGQGKVPDQELLENRLVLQHTGQREACIQIHTHTHKI